MKGIITWFACNGVAANFLMMLVLCGGIFTLWSDRIPLEVFPEFDPNEVIVRVPYRGATPEEIEESIVIPIEENIQDVKGIERIISESSENSGTVMIEIDRNYERRAVLDDIKSQVDGINIFPDEAEKPLVSLAQGYQSVISVVLSGDLSELDLRLLGEQVRDDLTTLPNVANVELQGVRPYEIAIEIPEETLQEYNLSFDDVSRAIRNSSIDLPAGSLRTEAGDVLLRTKGRAYTLEDFEQIVLRTRQDGTRLVLSDIAEIKDGFNENLFYSMHNGRRAVMIAVARDGDQNAIEMAQEVKAYMEESRDRLPPGVRIDFWSDRSTIVKGRLNTLVNSAVMGSLLVFVVLTLFLRFSLAFWVMLGIPLAFLGAIALMPYLGVTINIISLFAFILVLGIVVDDAIVTGENIYTLQRRGVDPLTACIQGTHEVSVPVTFGVLTTVAAFVPLLLIEGYRGQMYMQIPAIVIPVLLFSLIESKLILPAHLRHMRVPTSDGSKSPNPFVRGQDFFARGLEKFIKYRYQPLLGKALEYRYLTLAVFAGLLIVLLGVITGGHIHYVAFPRVQSEKAVCRLSMQDGTPFDVTEKHVMRIYEVAREMQKTFVDPDGTPVIESILVSIGGQGLGSSRRRNSSGESNNGEVVLEVRAPEDRKLKITSTELTVEWRKGIGTIVGAEELTFRAEIGRGSDPVEVQLTSANPGDLTTLADRIKKQLTEYPGLFDIGDTLDNGRDEIQLKITPQGEQFGLTMADLARQVRQAFYGEEVQRIQRGRDDIRVMLRYPKRQRETLASLEKMRIRTPEGDEVPFAVVAEASIGRSYSRIRRVDRKRAISITADADKERIDVEAIKADLDLKIAAMVKDYPGMNYSFEGEDREERESFAGIKLGMFFVFFAIYAMLAVPFRSYLQPLIVMSVIPFGLIGAVLGHMLMGLTLSIYGIFGMLALSGVVVNDSLVLVDYVNQRRAEGVPLAEAVFNAGGARFRAIILTSFTTFAGVTPVLLEQATQAQFLKPMAVSLGFGILFATAITLVLVPINYLILEDFKGLFAGKEKAGEPATLEGEAAVR